LAALYFFFILLPAFFVASLFLPDKVLSRQEMRGVLMKTFAMHPTNSSTGQAVLFQASKAGLSPQLLALVPGIGKLTAAALDGDVILIPDHLQVAQIRRLVVLIPPGDIDEQSVARRVYQLASGSRNNVLYLAMDPEGEQSPFQRRQLASLASLTTGKDVYSEVKLCVEKTWFQALEKILAPGDLLVCLADHTVFNYFFLRRKLGERLAGQVTVPVYLVNGLKVGRAPQTQRILIEAEAWISFFVLLGSFFVLQAGIQRSTEKPLTTILLCLSILVEVYFLSKINEWIG
jgi:hypothetical protein